MLMTIKNTDRATIDMKFNDADAKTVDWIRMDAMFKTVENTNGLTTKA